MPIKYPHSVISIKWYILSVDMPTCAPSVFLAVVVFSLRQHIRLVRYVYRHRSCFIPANPTSDTSVLMMNLSRAGGFDHCIAYVRLTTNCRPATIVNTRFIHLLITSNKQLAPPSPSHGQPRLFPLLHLQAFQRLLTSSARVQDSLKHPLQYSNHSYRLLPHAGQPSTARVLDT